jgi:hypothetical protein
METVLFLARGILLFPEKCPPKFPYALTLAEELIYK